MSSSHIPAGWLLGCPLRAVRLERRVIMNGRALATLIAAACLGCGSTTSSSDRRATTDAGSIDGGNVATDTGSGSDAAPISFGCGRGRGGIECARERCPLRATVRSDFRARYRARTATTTCVRPRPGDPADVGAGDRVYGRVPRHRNRREPRPPRRVLSRPPTAEYGAGASPSSASLQHQSPVPTPRRPTEIRTIFS